jgi:hypothetical protein
LMPVPRVLALRRPETFVATARSAAPNCAQVARA